MPGVREQDLNPVLTREEGGDNEHTVLEMKILAPYDSAAIFTPTIWTGLTQSVSRSGADLSRVRFVEVWVNDMTQVHAQTRAMFAAAGLDTFHFSTFEFPPPQSATARWLDGQGETGRRRGRCHAADRLAGPFDDELLATIADPVQKVGEGSDGFGGRNPGRHRIRLSYFVE